LPYSSTSVAGHPTLFGSFGGRLSASNFNFYNIVDLTDCKGAITFTDIPMGRYHTSLTFFRNSSTSFASPLTYSIGAETNVYFNRDYADSAYMLDEVAYGTGLPPVGPGSVYSVGSSYRNLVIDFYFTTTSNTNDFTLTLTYPGSFPSLDVNSQNGLFTCVQVGPSTVASAGELNFVFVVSCWCNRGYTRIRGGVL
jgi:hypothetical protein